MKKKIEIWSEGYLATGMEGIPAPAHLHGVIEAENLREACEKLAEADEGFKGYFNAKNMSYWGCRLFDNEADARKSFG
jgi:hypothetical protein